MSSITVGGNVVDAGGRGPQGPPGAATPATTSALGAVIVGDNLTVDETGRVSAPAQTGGVPEAPNDGNAYVRESEAWVELPVIPAAQVPADWNATTGAARILNKPAIPVATPFNDLQIVASGGFYNGGDSGYTGYKANIQKVLYAPNGCQDIVIGWSNTQSGGELGTYGHTIACAALINGECVPFTFNGALSYTFTQGIKYTKETDSLSVRYEPGDKIYLLFWVSPVDGNSTVPSGMVLDASAGDKWSIATTEANQTLNPTYNFPQFAGQSGQAFWYGPSYILGRVGALHPALGILADSLGAGVNDANHFGLFHRAFKGGSIPYTVQAMQGEGLGLSQLAFSEREKAIRYAPKIINELMINNVAGNSLSDIQNFMITRARQAVNTGKQYWTTTPTPYTDAGNTAPAHEAVRGPLKAWILAGYPMDSSFNPLAPGAQGALLMRATQAGSSNPFYNFLDTGSQVEQGSTGLWIPAYLSDGIHPNGPGYAQQATILTAQAQPALFEN